MTTRSLSRFVAAMAVLALTAVLLFSGSKTSASRGDRSAPTTPTNLTVTAVTETSVSLSWNASTDNSGKFSYRVRITNLSNSAYNSLATVSQTQTSHTPRFLSTNSSYQFAVYAVDGSGNRSAESNVVSATTLADTTAPSAPVLQASVLGPSQVQLTWTKSTDNIPNHCCNYDVQMNGAVLTQHVNWAAAPAGSLSAVIRHLMPGSTNSFSIKVTDWSGGNVSTSNVVTRTTPPSSDVTPPTAPTNLRLVQDDSCGEVWLGWTEATDDVDDQEEIEYEIYVNGVLSPLPVSAGIDFDFVYGVSNADNVFTVKAVDKSGNTSTASNLLKLFLRC
ncbi:MAG TPA: fibronectin type III domain-containing protein [Pyrinomonadaceae bacterium]|nr:fibronectin type III domain-containing protein [Pyrinomonadaceae bacterium]